MEKTSHDRVRDEAEQSKLEACGSDLRDKLIKLFDTLYLTPKVSGKMGITMMGGQGVFHANVTEFGVLQSPGFVLLCDRSIDYTCS